MGTFLTITYFEPIRYFEPMCTLRGGSHLFVCARAETAGLHLHVYVCRCALGTKNFHSPPPLLRWELPCGHFFTKKFGFGGVLGVFGPILAHKGLFWPTKGQNRAKYTPKTPQKPDFLVKKWPQGHPQRRRGGGSEKIRTWCTPTYMHM